MRIASRKGAAGDRGSEVSGTAKAGMYEQKLHKRHGKAVKVAQHTEGRTYGYSGIALYHVDADSVSGKRVHLTGGGLHEVLNL